MKNTILTTLFSLFVFVLSAQNYTMNNGSKTACSGCFYVSVGSTGDYKPSLDLIVTVKKTQGLAEFTVEFMEFAVGYGDWLKGHEMTVNLEMSIQTKTK